MRSLRARPAVAMLARACSLLALSAALVGCASTPPAPTARFDGAAVEAGVRATLDAQVAAWNAGSVRGFMDGYARTDTLRFLSGGTVREGWEEAFYGYVRGYPDATAMGQLAFSNLDVTPLSAEHALVWGRWRLQRDGDAPGAGPGGLFTLLLADTPDGWRVVHDHTSSE